MSHREFTTSSPVSARVAEEFSLDRVTPLGGANLLLDYYLGVLQLPRLFERHLAVRKAPWADYPMASVATLLVVGSTLGMARVSHFEGLEQEPLLCLKLGLPKLPDFTILYKDLERFQTWEALASIEEAGREVLDRVLGPDVILDIDSTVETVFGNQQGAEVGYNARYRGRKSYHPLFAFDGNTRGFLHAQLRPGNALSAEGMIAFYRECAARLPKGRTIRTVRMDRGFAGEQIYAFLEDDARVQYVGKHTWTSGLENALPPQPQWTRVVDGDELVEVAETWAQLSGWTKFRRVIVARRRPADEFLADTLDPDWYWDYQALVTNLDGCPQAIWSFYNARGEAENYIKETKEGFSIHHVPTGHFLPNAADMLLKMVAYNSFLAFQKDVATAGYQRFTVRRMRRLFFQIPGVLVKHARRWILRLPRQVRHQAAWLMMRGRLAALAT